MKSACRSQNIRKNLIGCIIFFALPLLGYLGFAFVASYYAGDALHTTLCTLCGKAAVVIDQLYPLLCVGFVCGHVAQSGLTGNGFLFFGGLASRLLPYLCEITKNLLVSPSLRKTQASYLAAAAEYTAVNYPADAALYLLPVLVAFFLSRKPSRRRWILALSLGVGLFVCVRIGLNIADTVEFIHEQTQEYYNPITGKEVAQILLSYIKILLFGVLGWLASIGAVLISPRRTA